MKRALCFLLTALLLLAVTSCTKNDETPPTQTEQRLPQTEPTSDSETAPETAPPVKTGFEEAEKYTCRRIADGDWKKCSFAFETDLVALSFPVPTDWSFIDNDDGTWCVESDGLIIGTVSTKAQSDVLRTRAVGSAETETLRSRCESVRILEEDIDFRRVFIFTYGKGDEERTIFLNIGYVDLNDDACRTLLSGAVTTNRNDSVGMVKLRANAPKKILILGNSFVGTSKIGDFLRNMIAVGGDGYTVTAVSVGYACIKTWTQTDTDYLNKIRAGEFAAVFQCGFYHSEDPGLFSDMVKACAASDTKLVIFPAHNENQSILNQAIAKFPEVTVLNWKKDVAGLISSGVSKWDLCYDDQHLHSTPLAGYVGAHMIYRAVFGKIPGEITKAPLSMTEVKFKLGQYPATGLVPSQDSVTCLLK